MGVDATIRIPSTQESEFRILNVKNLATCDVSCFVIVQPGLGIILYKIETKKQLQEERETPFTY